MATAESASVQKEPFPFLKLPSELQLKVLNRLSYDEISRCRLVCKAVDHICQQALNAGLHRVERFHARSLQRVKAQLPRRESERRTHELARHSDILTSIETRLSLLSMTYGKYIDSTLCCFIPGKVLDEMFRVLRIVNNTPRGDQAPRPHELLQELRDISSMAMEHFEEHIVPLLRYAVTENLEKTTYAFHFRDRICMSPSPANSAAAASLSTSALVLYAAANGGSPLLAPLSTGPKGGIGVNQAVHYSDTGRRHRFQTHFAFPSIHPSPTDSHQRHEQRYQNLKRQYQSQRNELVSYKRELSRLRVIQQRQRGKLNDMDRRLNEHEQRFIDLFAQLRNNGMASTSTSSNDESINGTGQKLISATGGGIGKRKRGAQSSAEPSTMEPVSSAIAVGCAAKRRKLDNKASKK